MKYFIHILLFSSLFFASCSKQENEALLKQLDDIKAMGDTLPQIAIQRLDSIKPLFDNETEYMRNKLALLEIRLQDKAYITHTTDKQIKDICSFFEKNGTETEKQETYYYMGSVYRDLNDYPNAVTFFLKSAEIAEKAQDIDVKLWRNTYSQLSHLYKRQFDYSEALNTILKGLSVSLKNGISDLREYANVANCYFIMKDTISTIKYYNSLIENINNTTINIGNSDIIATAMGDYALLGYKNEANTCYNSLTKLSNEELPYNYLANLAIYYEHAVSTDSAAIIRLELYNTTSRIESKYDAARWLTRYYTQKGE